MAVPKKTLEERVLALEIALEILQREVALIREALLKLVPEGGKL